MVLFGGRWYLLYRLCVCGSWMSVREAVSSTSSAGQWLHIWVGRLHSTTSALGGLGCGAEGLGN